MRSLKHSIRLRFTLIFIGLTAAVIICLWGANTWWLEGFYMREKVKDLELAYAQVDGLIKEEQEAGRDIAQQFKALDELRRREEHSAFADNALIKLIQDLNEKSNITLLIMDSANGTLLSSERRGDFLSERFLRNILGQNERPFELVSQTADYTIQKSFDPRNKSYYLECWGFLSDDSTSFIMSMPVASVRESVELSNRFLAYVGLAALAGGSILIYFTTKMVVSPILSLTNLSERMSNLDFDAHYTGNASDEIGVLGHSMNLLSQRLKETVGELKTANLKLQKDIEEKTQIDEMRKEFIANVSHELKTPIALIQGYAEGLTEGMAQDPESRDYYCEVIMDEANKMNKMVKQLLTLSALESGNDAPVMERFDLTELIRGILSSAQLMIGQNGAEVEFFREEPCFVWADEFKIEEVVTNYLNNAINHVQGERRIRIDIEAAQDEVRVTVFNTGNPIPEEDLPNLWTKFYKVDKARTRAYGGSGIGLSIVKAIMDSHQKECGAENVEGGVVFWFTLERV
ncbi:MAG: HAMP domain-containing protein [Lachnospiraceae bacterium]|nr:HAMP domain-containing protein [Lachnospiraceae bacterium]